MNIVYEDTNNKLNLFNRIQSDKMGYTRITMSPYFNRLDLQNRQTILDDPPKNGTSMLGDSSETKNTIEFLYKSHPYNVYSSPKQFQGKYIIPVGVNRDPSFWGGMEKYGSKSVVNLPNTNWGHLFELINTEFLLDLRSKRAFLAIDSSLEGYHEDWVWDYFREGCIIWGIPIEQIVYITGNSIVEDDLDRWKLENNNKKNVNVIGYSHFEWDMGNNMKNLIFGGKTLPTWLDHYKYKKENFDQIKTYNFLNRKPRGHRLWLYSLLDEYKMLDEGIISMNKPNGDFVRISSDHILDPNLVDELSKTLPKKVNNKGNMDEDALYYINRFNEDINLNSFISIISEAQYDDEQKTVFLSEKTFKTIACSQPFIILGNKGSLKELHKMGYKTFSSAFSEGYDQCEDIERLYCIVDLLKHIHYQPHKLKDFMFWTRHMVERNLEVLKFNTIFQPPAGFHMLLELLNEEICTKTLNKNII
mgnify:FL=1|tara:strand:+ start:3916 stop:5337 length:1422 start_codon:yes stop_codon:yes gene_type:complete